MIAFNFCYNLSSQAHLSLQSFEDVNTKFIFSLQDSQRLPCSQLCLKRLAA